MYYYGIKSELEKYLSEKGLNPQSFSAKEITDTSIELYNNQRIENCDLENDGDMLLFQWGTYDWGKGRFFQIDMTRQMICSDGMYQMNAIAYYEPSKELESIKAGNQWCSNLSEVETFKGFIKASGLMDKVESIDVIKSEIIISRV